MKQLQLFNSNRDLKKIKKQRQLGPPQEWKVVSLRECPAPESLILMDSPTNALEYWHQHIAVAPHFRSDVECVAVLVLNSRLRITGHHLVSVGSLDEAMAYPREVFRIAVMSAASAIVLMHNHPSGDSTPSAADRVVTKVIKESGQLLRIRLCDHIIVGHHRYFSFTESGII